TGNFDRTRFFVLRLVRIWGEILGLPMIQNMSRQFFAPEAPRAQSGTSAAEGARTSIRFTSRTSMPFENFGGFGTFARRRGLKSALLGCGCGCAGQIRLA